MPTRPCASCTRGQKILTIFGVIRYLLPISPPSGGTNPPVTTFTCNNARSQTHLLSNQLRNLLKVHPLCANIDATKRQWQNLLASITVQLQQGEMRVRLKYERCSKLDKRKRFIPQHK